MKDSFVIRGKAAVWLVVVTFLSIMVGARLENSGAIEGFFEGLAVMAGPVVLFVLVNRLWFFYRLSKSSPNK